MLRTDVLWHYFLTSVDKRPVRRARALFIVGLVWVTLLALPAMMFSLWLVLSGRFMLATVPFFAVFGIVCAGVFLADREHTPLHGEYVVNISDLYGVQRYRVRVGRP